mgnify:CR=1 FL=1
MLPKSESNDSQKPNYTVLEKSNAQGISPSDNLLKTSIKSDTEIRLIIYGGVFLVQFLLKGK